MEDMLSSLSIVRVQISRWNTEFIVCTSASGVIVSWYQLSTFRSVYIYWIIYTYCTVLAVLVRFTEYTTQLFTIFYCQHPESVLQSFLTVDSDPLMSCVGAVRWCPLASSTGCQLTWLFTIHLSHSRPLVTSLLEGSG
jgi:hypothetical protein